LIGCSCYAVVDSSVRNYHLVVQIGACLEVLAFHLELAFVAFVAFVAFATFATFAAFAAFAAVVVASFRIVVLAFGNLVLVVASLVAHHRTLRQSSVGIAVALVESFHSVVTSVVLLEVVASVLAFVRDSFQRHRIDSSLVSGFLLEILQSVGVLVHHMVLDCSSEVAFVAFVVAFGVAFGVELEVTLAPLVLGILETFVASVGVVVGQTFHPLGNQVAVQNHLAVQP